MRTADRSARRTLARIPMAAAAIHGAAAVALAFVLAPGVSLSYGPANASYIAAHLWAWQAGWLLWIAAAVSLLAFLGWWAARLGWTGATRVAVVIGAVGVLADVSAEARLVAWSPELDVGGALRQSGVVANACYSAAGAVLMAGTPCWPRVLAAWGWGVWLSGAGLSVAAALSSDAGSAVLTAVIFVLFVPWLVVAGRWLS